MIGLERPLVCGIHSPQASPKTSEVQTCNIMHVESCNIMNVEANVWPRSCRQALRVVCGLCCRVDVRLDIVENLTLGR